MVLYTKLTQETWLSLHPDYCLATELKSQNPELVNFCSENSNSKDRTIKRGLKIAMDVIQSQSFSLCSQENTDCRLIAGVIHKDLLKWKPV